MNRRRRVHTCGDCRATFTTAGALSSHPCPARFKLLAYEFPDYSLTDLPAIPADWIDDSWHNDVCPSFVILAQRSETDQYVKVWVDYKDPEKREINPDERYCVCRYEADSTPFDGGLSTNDWGAVLHRVAAERQRKR